MSKALNDDQKRLKDGRKNLLKDAEVPLKEQVQKKLLKRLNDDKVGLKVREMWDIGNSRRADWLMRYEKLMEEYDEFLEPIYNQATHWSSTLHLPVALNHAKTYHARMLAALMGIDPPFTVRARQAAREEQALLVQDLMRYTLAHWTNYNKGIEEVVDAWLWSWVVSGVGIMKVSWDREYTRYVDVVKQTKTDENTGITTDDEVEIDVTKKCFDGPVVKYKFPEDVLIVGGDGDPDEADAVIEQEYLTASQLWTLADAKIFDRDAVDAVIKAGQDYINSEMINSVKSTRAMAAGVTEAESEIDLQRYQILEAYISLDVDDSGINSEIIVWVHKPTGKILRATYLYRVMPTGLRPYMKIDFHKRHGQDYGVGLIELIYSLTKELDAISNMKIDFGLISTMPMGFVRSTSSLSEEKLPYEPGSLIPLDNPQTDVFFPQMGNRSVFAAQEEQFLLTMVERFTGISDLSLGTIGGQGAARTASGVRALLGESNANLDVFLRRMNRGWRRTLIYVFHMLQEKLPDGFTFRVFGDDGNAYFRTVKSREELAGMFDFELEPNSANSNRQIQLEVANQIYQMTGNPLDIQLGIIGPLQRFEALKNMLVVNGVRDYSKYILKPDGATRVFTPLEMANRILAGMDVQMGPEQDLQGYLDLFEHFMSEDEILGSYSEEQTIMLAKKAKEASQMLEALQAQAAQAANAQQIQTNAGLTTKPTQLPGGGQSQPPPAGGEAA